MSKGWIKLHRKIQDCELWLDNQPFDRRSAWIDLLLLANHEDVELLFDYKPMTVATGQYLTSVRQLSARWSWSKDRTLKFLRTLEMLKMIHRDSNNKRTLITIENYALYQNSQDTDKDTDKDAGRTQTGRRVATNKNIKNDKNEKNNKDIYGEYNNVKLTSAERDKLFNEFGEYETLEAIKYLDEYIEMKGIKYRSHYLALRKWVFDAVNRGKSKQTSQIDWSAI